MDQGHVFYRLYCNTTILFGTVLTPMKDMRMTLRCEQDDYNSRENVDSPTHYNNSGNVATCGPHGVHFCEGFQPPSCWHYTWNQLLLGPRHSETDFFKIHFCAPWGTEPYVALHIVVVLNIHNTLPSLPIVASPSRVGTGDRLLQAGAYEIHIILYGLSWNSRSSASMSYLRICHGTRCRRFTSPVQMGKAAYPRLLHRYYRRADSRSAGSTAPIS